MVNEIRIEWKTFFNSKTSSTFMSPLVRENSCDNFDWMDILFAFRNWKHFFSVCTNSSNGISNYLFCLVQYSRICIHMWNVCNSMHSMCWWRDYHIVLHKKYAIHRFLTSYDHRWALLMLTNMHKQHVRICVMVPKYAFHAYFRCPKACWRQHRHDFAPATSRTHKT